MVLEAIFSTTYEKEEVKIKSYITMMIRVMWYVFRCKSSIQAQISPYITLHISMLNWNNAYIKWANFRLHHLYQLYRKISRSILKPLCNMYDILRPRMSLRPLRVELHTMGDYFMQDDTIEGTSTAQSDLKFWKISIYCKRIRNSKDALTMAVVAAPKRAISESTDNWPMKVAKASNISTR